MENEKQKFLNEHRELVQKQIWKLELDLRQLKRNQIVAKDSMLSEIEQVIKINKTKIQDSEERLVLIDDIIRED